MIELTRLNGSPLVVNSDLIKTAEAAPDTMLTLITGEKLIVREDCAEVIERGTAYRARLRVPGAPASGLGAGPSGGGGSPAGCPHGRPPDDEQRRGYSSSEQGK